MMKLGLFALRRPTRREGDDPRSDDREAPSHERVECAKSARSGR